MAFSLLPLSLCPFYLMHLLIWNFAHNNSIYFFSCLSWCNVFMDILPLCSLSASSYPSICIYFIYSEGKLADYMTHSLAAPAKDFKALCSSTTNLKKMVVWLPLSFSLNIQKGLLGLMVPIQLSNLSGCCLETNILRIKCKIFKCTT